MQRRVPFIVALLLLAAAGPPPQRFDAANVGGPASDAPAELFQPPGPGPFPAMVVLHPCSGMGPHVRAWARRLVSWGYVAIAVDSFRPRGTANVCTRGRDVPAELRASDGFAAAAYLRTLPNVRGDRIGVIGFSHGGWAVLKAVLADAAAAARALPFNAAVAFYPGCERPRSPLVTDTLILMGDADDWTPPANCLRWRDLVQTDGHVLAMYVYPGALHSFDSARGPRSYMGHQIGRDPAAAADAFVRARQFLDERLVR